MVIIDIVINTLLGTVIRHPAGMHCPSWDDAFVSSYFGLGLVNSSLSLGFGLVTVVLMLVLRVWSCLHRWCTRVRLESTSHFRTRNSGVVRSTNVG